MARSDFRFWYFQDKKASRLDADQWALTNAKLQSFGGIMVYRDGLRVLPYGRREEDWLRIEERRSKGAGYYFFSYRRMFGYVEIARSRNSGLLDKAGREGFLRNAAYRDLNLALQEFFIFLARQYFAKGTEFHDLKRRLQSESGKTEKTRRLAARRREELRAKAMKKILFIEEVGAQQLETAFEEATGRLSDGDNVDASGIMDAQYFFEYRVAKIKDEATFSIPKTISPRGDTELRQLEHDHHTAFAAFSKLCGRYRKRFGDFLRKEFRGTADQVNRRRVVEAAHGQALENIRKANQALRRRVTAQMDTIDSELDALEEDEISRVSHAWMTETGTSSLEEAKTVDIEEASDLLAAISEAGEVSIANLEEHQQRLTAHLSSYFGDAPDETIAAQTGLIEELTQEVDRNLELVQLGLSVEIIDHDLNQLYRGIRSGLNRLRNLVRNAPKASGIVDDLRSNFQHFEQRYRLMSPLYRGSYRTKSEIDGTRIFGYCKEFLDRSLRSADVRLEATDAFLLPANHGGARDHPAGLCQSRRQWDLLAS